MADGKKPSLALVIGKGRDDAEEDAPDSMAPESEGEGDEDYSASVDELFDALKNDDRDAFHDAFKAAVMSCK
jgi:hypothetical protein